MKLPTTLLTFSLLLSIILTGISCKKEEKTTPGSTEVSKKPLDTSNVHITADNGNIGLAVDVRPIYKKGYHVSKVKVDIDGALSKFSQTMDVDTLTNLGILKIKRDSLSPAQVEQFAKGVNITITAYDKSNKVVANTAEKGIMFNDSGEPFPVETDMPAIIHPVRPAEGIPYYIQKIPFVYQGNNEYITIPYATSPYPFTNIHMDQFLGEDKESLQTFYFQPAGDGSGTYFIKLNDSYYLRVENNKVVSYAGTLPGAHSSFQFKFTPDGKGGISIYSYQGGSIRQSEEQVGLPGLPPGSLNHKTPILSDNAGTALKFRFVPAGLIWSVTDLGMVMSDPILPPKKIDFAYGSVLMNCSGATLSENVGVTENRETTYTVGSEESFQLTSSNSLTVGVSTTVSASGSFAGVGASASVEVSADYNYTRTMTETQTRNFSNSITTTTEVSRSRTADLPPYSAIRAYDAVESYKNVRIPFVQKLRVAGELNGKKLSGEAIVSQLMSNQFEGLVVDVEATYVVISVRGTATIENLMKATSKQEDIPNACSR